MRQKAEVVPEPTLFDHLQEALTPKSEEKPSRTGPEPQESGQPAEAAPASPAEAPDLKVQISEAADGASEGAAASETTQATPAAPQQQATVISAASLPTTPSSEAPAATGAPVATIVPDTTPARGTEPMPAAPSAIALPPAATSSSDSGAWWTIPLLCIGICMIGCALVIGQVESNRQLAWQRNKLKQDYEFLQRQTTVYEEFLKDIQSNPTLAERLAQRQMKEVRQGTAVLDVPALGRQDDRNPFALVNIAPPPPLLPYQPRPSVLGWLCGTEQRRLIMTAMGLFLVAAGLVLGGPTEVRKTAGRASV